MESILDQPSEERASIALSTAEANRLLRTERDKRKRDEADARALTFLPTLPPDATRRSAIAAAKQRPPALASRQPWNRSVKRDSYSFRHTANTRPNSTHRPLTVAEVPHLPPSLMLPRVMPRSARGAAEEEAAALTSSALTVAGAIAPAPAARSPRSSRPSRPASGSTHRSTAFTAASARTVASASASASRHSLGGSRHSLGASRASLGSFASDASRASAEPKMVSVRAPIRVTLETNPRV